MKYEIKSCIREIERLLGPSFPISTFALALQDELRLKGIKSAIYQPSKYCVILETELIEVRVEMNMSNSLNAISEKPTALWLPHKYLIFPEISRAVA